MADNDNVQALQEPHPPRRYRETGTGLAAHAGRGGGPRRARTRLVKLVERSIAEVKKSGEALSRGHEPYERKVVHDTAPAAGSCRSPRAPTELHVVISRA